MATRRSLTSQRHRGKDGRVREKTKTPGVYKIHARGCAGGRCRCDVAFQASVYSAREDKKIRKHFTTLTEAELWRGELRGAVKRGEAQAPGKTTFDQAAEELLAGMRDGTIKTRSGEEYAPATIRRYELALTKHLCPVLGRHKLSSIDYTRIEHMLAGWWREGMTEPSSVRNNLDPARVIFRRAKRRKEVTLDPIKDQDLPQGRGRRERVADRVEAQVLIDALPVGEQALWATALYAGLRRGELKALRCDDLHFDEADIEVREGWDDVEGARGTKSEAGERRVPMVGILARYLRAHLLVTGRRGDDLVFGRTATLPFVASTVRARALKAWGWKQVKNPALALDPKAKPATVWIKAREDAITPLTLHEGRHSTASYLVEAGANDLELAAVIGHSDPRTTKSIYTHLFEGSGAKITAQLDAYLDASAG
jgi:integrase